MQYLLRLSVVVFLVGCSPATEPDATERDITVLNPAVITPLGDGYSNNGTTLQLDPQQPVAEREFQLFLHLPAELQPQPSELRGVDMYMGKIPVRWQQVSPTKWQASVFVGACSLAHMQWQLSVPVIGNDATDATLQFQFFTQR